MLGGFKLGFAMHLVLYNFSVSKWCGSTSRDRSPTVTRITDLLDHIAEHVQSLSLAVACDDRSASIITQPWRMCRRTHDRKLSYRTETRYTRWNLVNCCTAVRQIAVKTLEI